MRAHAQASGATDYSDTTGYNPRRRQTSPNLCEPWASQASRRGSQTGSDEVLAKDRYAGASVTISQAQSPSASAETPTTMIRERRVQAREGVTLDSRSAVISRCDYALGGARRKAGGWYDQLAGRDREA